MMNKTRTRKAHLQISVAGRNYNMECDNEGFYLIPADRPMLGLPPSYRTWEDALATVVPQQE